MRSAIFAVIGAGVVSLESALATELPLKTGIFVLSDIACSDRSNFSAIAYWGDRLNLSPHIESTILSVSNKGKKYEVEVRNTGDFAGEGLGKTETWRVTVHSSSRLTVTSPYSAGKYRWCADRM